jgi:acid phosphatase (class B)
MWRKKSALLVFIICFLMGNCAPLSQEEEVRWVTIEEISRSLEAQPPFNVGFDVDDTVLFSSPGYHYGQQKYSPGSNAYRKMEEFWNEMNNGLDRFSLPKACARGLIELHKKRGDSIYFITGRTKTPTETLTEYLAQIFVLDNHNKVIFTRFKAQSIIEKNIQIFYGDSDSDMKAALEVGIRGIRIMRAGNSTYKPFPQYGNLGEEVLRDSEF